MKNQAHEQLIDRLLPQLTLEEKIRMIHGATLFRSGGVERLGIPALSTSDGPMGVRFEFADAEWRALAESDDYVTYLPCNSALASTWNRDLAYTAGQTLGAEARGRGKDIILAPGINIKRHPLCGRNFEYMSEDPTLVAQMAAPMVKGIQENDVAACAKHFAVNCQEANRLWVDTIVDEQTLQEIYFPGFRAAIDQGGLYTVMGAYNLLNGESCCTSQQLLNRVLREDWGFDGVVVSDWGGVHDTELAARSALDLEMNTSYDFDNHHMAQPLLEKIRAGELPESLVDEKVRNLLRLMLRLKMLGPDRENRSPGAYNAPAHRQAVRQVAEESIVLLKNETSVLPLDAGKVRSVAVIGANAATAHAFGGGSAEIRALYEITPLLGIKMLLGGNTAVRYAPGYHTPPKGGRPEISWQASSTLDDPQFPSRAEACQDSGKLLEEAVALAKQCDAVIFVGGLDHNYDVEGLDRNDMKLPYGQDTVIEALLEANPNTVVTLYAGSPVEMPWLSRAKAVVWSYYAGMEGGSALADVLFGRVNPSGKLAETFIPTVSVCPADTFGRTDRVEHREGLFVGYRHYDTAGVPVNFCFGHGLSYTAFRYSDMSVQQALDGCVNVRLNVTNTGPLPGKEVVQLYAAPADRKDRPSHTLRAFEKVALAPGQTAQVCFTLTARDFSGYDPQGKSFTLIPGTYTLQAAASSRDIRLTASIDIS